MPNDSAVTVQSIGPNGFVEVKKQVTGQTGWIQSRNLSKIARKPGAVAGLCPSIADIVTPDPQYVRGVRLYGVGIKQDPIPGEKRGKGAQHLMSPQWLAAMSEFAGVFHALVYLSSFAS